MIDSAATELQPTVSAHDAQAPLVLALDIGTSSVRALVFDRYGRMVTDVSARRVHSLTTDHSGVATMNANALLDVVFHCLDDFQSRAAMLRSPVLAVCGCTFVSNVLGLDADGSAITPVYTYADTRCGEDAASLAAELDETVCHDRTGCRFHSSYLPARLRWLRRTDPDLFGHIAHFASIGELIEQHIFGRSRISYSVAAWMGMQDRRELTWYAPLMDACGISRDQLGVLADASDALHAGDVLPAFASRWPALSGANWYPLAADGACANIGSGCVTPAETAITVGTSSAVRVLVPGAPATVPQGLWCYRVDSRRSLVGGALSEGGSVYAWLGGLLKLPTPAELEKLLADMEPDSHGLTVLPFVSGERAPGWCDSARAAIVGMSLATSPVQIVRAALESVAIRLGIVEQLVRQAVPSASATAPRVLASGGALLSSPAWMQIMADVLNQSVLASGSPEASARGAAMLALEAMGACPIEAQPEFATESFDPRDANHEVYCSATERQKRLYSGIINPGLNT